jgi:hypothetical protein
VELADRIASAALLVALVALVVSIKACHDGASEKKQSDEIDTLKNISVRLSQQLEDQLTANDILVNSFKVQLKTDTVLSNSLNAQQGEITATSHLDADIYNQLLISKKQLSILLDDNAFNAKLDSQSLTLGVSRLKSTFDFEISPFFKPPLDTVQNLGPLFDQKLASFEAMAISLASNRLMMSRTHEYENLGLLIDIIDRTHICLTYYGYKYRQVDSTIVKCFESIGLGVRYIEVYSPTTDETFKDEYKMVLSRLNTQPAKVFEQESKK